MTDRPLSGIRILDFTHVWAGPLATRILGDLGAEVIKVESPWARGPATLPPGAPALVSNYGEDHWNRQSVTNKLNRNKRGLCIDAKSAAGHAALVGLVKHCDVVIENFSARALAASMGLGWDVLKSVNPNIIYVAMPGFGISGCYADFVAYGTIVEPMCGLTAFMGYSAEEPRVSATAVPDASAGVTAAAAVVTALQRRDEEGVGGYVEISLQEAAMALFGEYFLLEQLEGTPPRMGNGHADYAPSGVYRCSGDDEWIAITARDETEWHNLAANAGLGWESEQHFGSLQCRHDNRTVLDETIQSWTCGFNKTELMIRLQEAGVPAGAVMVTPEFLEDPQVVDRQFFVEFSADHMDTKPFPGLPIRINDARGQGWQRAPKLGEHNHEILHDLLGMDDASIEDLERLGVIATRPPE
jgi:crotonobetainyl-CoA:carnitine CoA-transferase CaiB-like acyl-CoA transferase|tara:strand:+ start:2245 stop:3486 length:1242 start_codon:yes stop_codon:yes gene_type:complete